MASNEGSAKRKAPNFVQNCLLLSSSSVVHNPFLVRPIKPNHFPSPNALVRQLHTSITSTAEECLRFIHLFAAENPFLKKILSLSSDFNRHLSQIHCRKLRNANCLSNHNFAAVLPGDSVAGIVVANGILNFLNIYNTLLIVRLVLTWFPSSPPAIVSPLSTLCDPYLNIFRGIIPPLGGTLDLSPILAFLVLNAFTSAASALPAELPADLPGTGASQGTHPSPKRFTGLTSTHEKWMRRLYGNKSKTSTTVN